MLSSAYPHSLSLPLSRSILLQTSLPTVPALLLYYSPPLLAMEFTLPQLSWACLGDCHLIGLELTRSTAPYIPGFVQGIPPSHFTPASPLFQRPGLRPLSPLFVLRFPGKTGLALKPESAGGIECGMILADTAVISAL